MSGRWTEDGYWVVDEGIELRCDDCGRVWTYWVFPCWCIACSSGQLFEIVGEAA